MLTGGYCTGIYTAGTVAGLYCASLWEGFASLVGRAILESCTGHEKIPSFTTRG